MARLRTKSICEQCSQPFVGWTGNVTKFCCRACYHAGDRTRALERFWAKVKKTDNCWLWLGRRDKDGYGLSGIGRAHVVSFESANGRVSGHLRILHKCNNPPCVRPDHLYAGTPADNMKDRQNAGHYRTGESHPMAIINEIDVREIRAVYVLRKNGGVAALAEKYGVAATTIHAIISRKIWKHI